MIGDGAAKHSRFWNWAGKAAIIATILGVAVTYFAGRTPTPVLYVEVQKHPYVLPVGLAKSWEEHSQGFQGDSLSSFYANLPDDSIAAAQLHKLVRALQSAYEYQIGFFEMLGGFLTISIHNNGTATAKRVAVTLPPEAAYADIIGDTKSLTHHWTKDSGRTVDIGDLRPDESINLFAWVSGSPSTISDDVRVWQEYGRTRVVRLQPTPHFWYLVSIYWRDAVLILGGIVLTTLLIPYLLRVRPDSRR